MEHQVTIRQRRHPSPARSEAGHPSPRRWLAGGLVALVLLGMPLLASVAYAEDGDGSIQLRVVVIDSVDGGPTTPPPTGGPTTPPPTGGPSVTPTPSVPSQPKPPVLYVSPLDARYVPSLNPAGGDIVARFTVENVLKQQIDATTVFWATNIYGGPVGSPVTVQVKALRPKESRVVTGTIRNVGQWGLLGVHATLTPPYRVGTTVLFPITRHTLVVYVPWFLPVIAVPICVGGWFLRRRIMTSLPGEFWFLRWGGRV